MPSAHFVWFQWIKTKLTTTKKFIPLDLQGAYPRYDIHTSVFAVYLLWMDCLGRSTLMAEALSWQYCNITCHHNVAMDTTSPSVLGDLQMLWLSTTKASYLHKQSSLNSHKPGCDCTFFSGLIALLWYLLQTTANWAYCIPQQLTAYFTTTIMVKYLLHTVTSCHGE